MKKGVIEFVQLPPFFCFIGKEKMMSNDKLRFMRQHYHLRQADIADYIGKSLSYVKKVEANDLDITQEAHDKWLECCRLQVRSKKKNRDW